MYTKEQQQVIDVRNRNILVSAAAGSGKTAVLVERIITRLTKDASPIDVDQLLVVTFTEAAASEMKERIRNAIEKALEEQPDNIHLQRQATLVHQAQITTIHSFCLSVIRDYFHTIDLDPGFRVAEEGELKLLKRDILEEVLETWYQDAKPEFLNFVESYATGRDDKQLEEIILQMFEYSRSYPNPQAWLEGCVKEYDVESVEALEETRFMQILKADIRKTLEDVVERLKFAIEVCNEEYGPLAYGKALESDLQFIQALLRTESFEEMQKRIVTLKWDRLAVNRDKSVSEKNIEIVKSIRENCKKSVERIRDEYFFDDVKELQKGMFFAKSNMRVLAALVKDFSTAFLTKKQSKNMIDFNDMEYYALQILTRQKDGILVPSEVAKEYQEQYQEVMIDEYQDSNYIQEAILTSVSKVSQGIHNIFMVGDVKQSIYRFRLSRPELFMEKYHTYSEDDSEKQRIDLHKNFRSRREVLEGTNFVFKQIMTRDFGGIEYDDDVALYVGATYDEQPNNETEVCFVDVSNMPEKYNKRELEARAIAGKIKKLVGNHLILDKKTNTYRKVGYGDIVVLTRSLKGWTDVFLREFQKEGIPAYSVSKEGYFETREIQMLLNYLKILDNPRQDIPFAAVLTSPFAAISNEELALIQSEMEGKHFYGKVRQYIENGSNEVLQKKLIAFLKQYGGFRKKVPYTAIHVLLWEIMEQTGYGNFMAAMPDGQQRTANLEMLIEKAIGFESTSYKGLFHFVRYIEQLYKYEIDYGEANIMEESAQVVRLMSIHKSKGLEFPIVFVAGMDKSFNLQDARSNIVIHSDLGVGLDFIDVEKRVKYPSLLKRIIQSEVVKESVAEELRILYVAMTRAKEKLILIGTISNLEERVKKCMDLGKREERMLPYTRLTKAKNYFDWVIPSLFRNQVFEEIFKYFELDAPFGNVLYKEEVPIQTSVIEYEEIVLEEMEEEYRGIVTKQILANWNTEQIYDEVLKTQLEQQFAFHYPYEIDLKTKQKKSVSELKKRIYMEEEEIEEEEMVPLLPKFMQEDTKLTGASRGTAYHRVLELLDFSREYDHESLKQAIEEMVVQEKMTKEMADCVRRTDILKFFQSPIGKRVQKACLEGKFHAEQPFVFLENQKDEDSVLIQGIIDAYFEEDGELVVLDYKTDRVWKERELIERYQSQLGFYADALTQMTAKRVKEKVIYSFTLQKEIEV